MKRQRIKKSERDGGGMGGGEGYEKMKGDEKGREGRE